MEKLLYEQSGPSQEENREKAAEKNVDPFSLASAVCVVACYPRKWKTYFLAALVKELYKVYYAYLFLILVQNL